MSCKEYLLIESVANCSSCLHGIKPYLKQDLEIARFTVSVHDDGREENITYVST